MSKLIAEISRKPIPEHQKSVIIEIHPETPDGEEVEAPYVMLKLDK